MTNFEHINVSGTFHIQHIRNGKVIDERNVHNLVTSSGKALVAGRINGSGTPAAVAWIGIGTGTNAAAPGDVALQTEVDTTGTPTSTHTSASVSLVTTSVANDTAQLQATFSFSGSVAVTESGTFNASSSGTLLSRQVFSAINVISGDSIVFTWKIQAT